MQVSRAPSRGPCEPQRGFLCGQGHPGSWLQAEEAPGGPGWGRSAPRPSLGGGQTWPGPARHPWTVWSSQRPAPHLGSKAHRAAPCPAGARLTRLGKGLPRGGHPEDALQRQQGLHPGLSGWEWQEPRPRDKAGLKPSINLRALCSFGWGQALFRWLFTTSVLSAPAGGERTESARG